ncbi:carrier protein Rim2p/Mrs12p, partial [Aureobasidium sp. EXF-3399]
MLNLFLCNLAMADAQQIRLSERSWPHLVAGGAGGITTAIATAPLDVLRTRFQSNLYSNLWQSSAAVVTPQTSFMKAWLERVKITSRSVIMLQKVQGWRGLYTGLGPSILGAVPATAVNFYTYGNCKRIYADWFGLRENASSVHMTAAMTAGIATGTITNPIWVIKTRMQLDSSPTTPRPRHRTSLQCVMHIFEQEGIRGFYRGLSASYLGVAESALHLVLYERLKQISQSSIVVPREVFDRQQSPLRKPWDIILSYVGVSGSAAIAKLIAGVIAYPHEVSTPFIPMNND